MRNVQLATLLCCVGFGCAQPEAAAPNGPESSAGAEQAPAPATAVAAAPAAPAAKVAPDSMAGLWVEFWALSGQTDTQRYAFFEDGTFGWRAAGSNHSGVLRRWGRWSADGSTLVLSVQGEESACAGGVCQRPHEPPLEERVAIGDCPPNDEAKALDATYRCSSIGGRAFWRRGQADDLAAYKPR